MLFGSSVPGGSALTLTLGAAPNSAAVTISSGSVSFSSAGVYGELTTHVTLGTSGLLPDGLTATLALNTTNAMQTVGTDHLAPSSFAVTATGVDLTVNGQSLHGTFSFSQATIPVSAGAAPGTQPKKLVEIGVSNASITLGGSGATVDVTAVTGALLLSGGAVAGTLTATVGTTGLGATLTGTFTLAANSGGTAVNQQVNVGGTSVTINVPAGPYLLVKATGASLTVAGQTLSGDFSVQKSGSGVAITVANLSMSLGSGSTPVLTVTGGSGTFAFGTFNTSRRRPASSARSPPTCRSRSRA